VRGAVVNNVKRGEIFNRFDKLFLKVELKPERTQTAVDIKGKNEFFAFEIPPGVT
jgi:hypothetical protein